MNNALVDASKYTLFGIREPGISVQNLAKDILKQNNTNCITQFSKVLCKQFYNVLSSDTFFKKEKEAMYGKFLNLCNSEDINDSWLELVVGSSSSQVTNALKNFVLDYFLKKSIERFRPVTRDIIQTSEFQLSESEQQTVRYVGGYIAFSLKKAVKNKTSPEGKALVELIKQWGNLDDDATNIDVSLLNYTKAWVDVVNRGGLFIINNNFYLFIEKIEKVCRTIINLNLLATYCGEDILLVLLKKMNNNMFLDEAWNHLTNSLSHPTLLDQLKQKIFQKWINIRAHAFVKSWTQIAKENIIRKGGRNVEKAQPALRKSLATQQKISTPTKSIAKRKLLNAKKIQLRKLAKQQNITT